MSLPCYNKRGDLPNIDNRIKKDKKMEVVKQIVAGCIMVFLMTGCYHTHNEKDRVLSCDTTVTVTAPTVSTTTNHGDSYAFYVTHHYGPNYNFVVKADSITLLKQQPEELLSHMPTDSLVVRKGSHIVVADIRLLKNDKTDSVWIQVASNQYTFGWIHESKLLANAVPDDPISQFISTFSDTHLLAFLIIISLIAFAYTIYKLKRRELRIVHLNDIESFYPTLLAITVAIAAAFYSSIQMFAPDTWRHFYFHPSLNPFELPPLLAVFLSSVWLMVIMLLATIDDVYHKLPSSQAVLYLCGLAAVCSANYIVFSITTLYYVGYALLILYIIYAIRKYVDNNYYKYVCGSCGAKLRKKGKCPKCGAINL